MHCGSRPLGYEFCALVFVAFVRKVNEREKKFHKKEMKSNNKKSFAVQLQCERICHNFVCMPRLYSRILHPHKKTIQYSQSHANAISLCAKQIRQFSRKQFAKNQYEAIKLPDHPAIQPFR